MKQHQQHKALLTSSLPLQIFLYFHYYFFFLYFIIEIFAYIYKKAILPYPTNIFGWEISALVFLSIVDMSRLALGSKGNKTQDITLMVIFLILTVPSLLGSIFFLKWQTYILRLDQVVNIVSLIFISCEVLLALLTILTFWRNRSIQ